MAALFEVRKRQASRPLTFSSSTRLSVKQDNQDPELRAEPRVAGA